MVRAAIRASETVCNHFGSSHFLFERARCFSRSRAFLVLSCQVSATQFCSFPFFLMARVSDGTDVPVSPVPASSSNMESPNGSLPDLEGAKRVKARVTALETGAASSSGGPDSARSWNTLGHSDGSTATGSLRSHGPGSSDDNRNTRRRLDTFSSPEDDHARSAVLLRFPCEQHHTEVTNWINNVWEKSNIPAYNKLVRIHCKTFSLSVRLAFETRAKCQDIVARYKDDCIPAKLIVHFCQSRTNIAVRQSKSLEDREVGKQFAPVWKVLTQVPSLSLHLTSVHKLSASRIAETAWENQCSNLLRSAHSWFFFFLQQVISQASHLAQDRTANV